MKITGELIDCTFTFQPYDKELEKIKIDIGKRLPTIVLAELSNVLIVGTKNADYIVKIRPGYENFENKDFVKISSMDYIGDISGLEKAQTTKKLIHPGDYVYFQMNNDIKNPRKIYGQIYEKNQRL